MANEQNNEPGAIVKSRGWTRIQDFVSLELIWKRSCIGSMAVHNRRIQLLLETNMQASESSQNGLQWGSYVVFHT